MGIVIRLLYIYRYLNSRDLINLIYIDLIIYRISIILETKLFLV